MKFVLVSVIIPFLFFTQTVWGQTQFIGPKKGHSVDVKHAKSIEHQEDIPPNWHRAGGLMSELELQNHPGIDTCFGSEDQDPSDPREFDLPKSISQDFNNLCVTDFHISLKEEITSTVNDTDMGLVPFYVSLQWKKNILQQGTIEFLGSLEFIPDQNNRHTHSITINKWDWNQHKNFPKEVEQAVTYEDFATDMALIPLRVIASYLQNKKASESNEAKKSEARPLPKKLPEAATEKPRPLKQEFNPKPNFPSEETPRTVIPEILLKDFKLDLNKDSLDRKRF